MSSYYGNTVSETLGASNWNSAWTAFYMYDGNDNVIAPSTSTTAYYFDGGNGNDFFVGGSGSDRAYGGFDNDILSGRNGNDTLDGGANNDTLLGGSGLDRLDGGYGTDHLYGGEGGDYLYGGRSDGAADYFHFVKGDSNSTFGQADMIGDWDARYDHIDSSIAGTTSNYREAATSYTTIDNARWQVEHSSTLKVADHVFLYNAKTDTGFLLSDLDRNYTFETGVVIQGAGAASDMNWSHII